MNNIINLSNPDEKLNNIINKISEKSKHIYLKRRGSIKAVLMGINEYENLIETLNINKDKYLLKRIKKAKCEIKQGKIKSFEQIGQELNFV